METQIASFFNEISLKRLDELEYLDLDHICTKLDELHGLFEKHKSEIKSNINPTGRKLFFKTSVDLILKAIPKDEKNALRTQTEYLNYWLAKFLICQNILLELIKKLEFEYKRLIYDYEKYKNNNVTQTPSSSRILNNCIMIQRRVYGLCQNIGSALYDYREIYSKINTYLKIKESEFVPPPKFISPYGHYDIVREAEDSLLMTPSKSILGFSATRISMESYVLFKIQDLIRSHLRIKHNNNKIEVKFPDDFRTKELFDCVEELFPEYQKENAALDRIYSLSSKTIHTALAYPNYLIWGSFFFSFYAIEEMFRNVTNKELALDNLISRLQSHNRLEILNL